MEYVVEPIEGDSYNGRQIGYVIKQGDREVMQVSTGGTGDCWNVETEDLVEVDDDGQRIGEHIHICDLADFMGALEALRDSDAHRKHVARWA